MFHYPTLRNWALYRLYQPMFVHTSNVSVSCDAGHAEMPGLRAPGPPSLGGGPRWDRELGVPCRLRRSCCLGCSRQRSLCVDKSWVMKKPTSTHHKSRLAFLAAARTLFHWRRAMLCSSDPTSTLTALTSCLSSCRPPSPWLGKASLREPVRFKVSSATFKTRPRHSEDSKRTCFTHFCSSIRKARTMRSRTQCLASPLRLLQDTSARNFEIDSS